MYIGSSALMYSNRNVPAILVHNSSTHRKSKPGAFACDFRCEKRLKYPIHNVGSDSCSIVRDGQSQYSVVRTFDYRGYEGPVVAALKGIY